MPTPPEAPSGESTTAIVRRYRLGPALRWLADKALLAAISAAVLVGTTLIAQRTTNAVLGRDLEHLAKVEAEHHAETIRQLDAMNSELGALRQVLYSLGRR